MTHPFTTCDINTAKEAWELRYEFDWKHEGNWHTDPDNKVMLYHPINQDQTMVAAWNNWERYFETCTPLPLPHQVEVVMEEQLGWRKTSSQHSTDHWQTNNKVIGPVVKRPVHITHPTMVTRYLLALVEGLKRRGK